MPRCAGRLLQHRGLPMHRPFMTGVAGYDQTSRHVRVMSIMPLKADIHQRGLHVRLVP